MVDDSKLLQMAEDIAVTKAAMNTLTKEVRDMRLDVKNLSVVSSTEFKEHVKESEERAAKIEKRLDIVEDYVQIQQASWWTGFKKTLSNHMSKVLVALIIVLLLALVGMYGDVVKLTVKTVSP